MIGFRFLGSARVVSLDLLAAARLPPSPPRCAAESCCRDDDDGGAGAGTGLGGSAWDESRRVRRRLAQSPTGNANTGRDSR